MDFAVQKLRAVMPMSHRTAAQSVVLALLAADAYMRGDR